MTPTAIAADAKAATNPRSRGAVGSASAGSGFDGVLASLGDVTADADGGDAPSSAIGSAFPGAIASGAADDTSLIAALVDRAAGTSTATHAKNGTDDADASDQVSAQTAASFGLVGLLASVPTTAGNEAVASSVADVTQGAAGSKRGGPTTASNAKTATVTAALTTDPSQTDVAATSNERPAMPAIGSAAVAAGSPGSQVVATKARAEKSSDAGDPAATGDTETSGATLQSVSVSTQMAPSSSVHASQLARTNPTSATALGKRDATAESTSAPASKTGDPASDASAQMPAPVATIVDAVSDLADTQATSSASSAAPTSTPTLAPARTMVLQLAPADLGTVAVRLHLTGQTLDVQLSISDQKTLGLVSRERDALAARLDDRGYQLNTLTIQSSDPSASSTAGSHDTSHSGAAAARDQGADDGRRGSSGRSSQGDQGAGRQSRADRASAAGDASGDRRGGLYI